MSASGNYSLLILWEDEVRNAAKLLRAAADLFCEAEEVRALLAQAELNGGGR